jgi:hypothetical protein
MSGLLNGRGADCSWGAQTRVSARWWLEPRMARFKAFKRRAKNPHGVTKAAFRSSKYLITWKHKSDLKRLKLSDIIQTCDSLHFNDRCLLLSFSNDSEGRCVL